EARTLGDLPFTTKAELSEDAAAHPPFGSNLTYPLDRYVRIHQTSGTTGRPLRVLDTAESWQWWRDCWEPIYRAAGVTGRDRIFFAFSFGPFIGFWSAFAGAEPLGARRGPHQRGRARRRDLRPRDERGARPRRGRARCHPPRPLGHARDPLPHRRSRERSARPVLLRAHAGEACRWDRRADRRHGD